MDDRTRELSAAGGPADEAPQGRAFDADASRAPVDARTGTATGGSSQGESAGHPMIEVRNEAVPGAPPPRGTEPTGSIPGVHSVRRWARAQLTNWRLYLVLFLSSAVAVILSVVVVPGLSFTSWQWGQFTWIGIVFGLLNATVKPALHFVALRFIFTTYGVVVVVINAIVLALLAQIMDETLVASGLGAILLGGLLVGVLGLFLETLLGATPPVLDRDYRERHGLT